MFFAALCISAGEGKHPQPSLCQQKMWGAFLFYKSCTLRAMGAATYFVGELMDEMNKELFSYTFTFLAGICGSGLFRSAYNVNHYVCPAKKAPESFDGMVYLDFGKRARMCLGFSAQANFTKRSWMPIMDQKFPHPL